MAPHICCLCLVISIVVVRSDSYSILSGCEDGTVEGLQDEAHPAIAACAGNWTGHVDNANSLCGRGWRLCSWRDGRLLSSLNWEDATRLPGCYAMDATQEGGTCRPCDSDSTMSPLASVGSSCPHQSVGQDGCIHGGQMHVSADPEHACAYRPGLISGALCCRKPGVPPQILVRPQELTHVTSGVTFVLSCQAVGSPPPRVHWLKEGLPLADNVTRISAFDSGYLLISGAQPEDSGFYTCVVENMAGRDEAEAKVIVTDYESGCADGSTDGLYEFEEIQACKGAWQGHVKRAKDLCARGWRVCSPRHSNLLKLLTWTDVTALPGCYAYNAANIMSRCTRCHRADLAGVGASCGKIRRNARSCLAQGRIDVYTRREPGCVFQPDVTSGVLCCKRHDKKETAVWSKVPKCYPKCANGGTCVSNGRCECDKGYKGAWCQNPSCPGGCLPNSVCVRPGLCQCKKGFTGKKCTRRDKSGDKYCRSACLHGGRCKAGICKCPKSRRGEFCQFAVRWDDIADINRTEN